MKIVYKHNGDIRLGTYEVKELAYFYITNHMIRSDLNLKVTNYLQVHEKNVLGTYTDRVTDDQIYKEHGEYFL